MVTVHGLDHRVIARSVFYDEAIQLLLNFLDCHAQQKTLGSQ
jgi:hypothetical protein